MKNRLILSILAISLLGTSQVKPNYVNQLPTKSTLMLFSGGAVTALVGWQIAKRTAGAVGRFLWAHKYQAALAIAGGIAAVVLRDEISDIAESASSVLKSKDDSALPSVSTLGS